MKLSTSLSLLACAGVALLTAFGPASAFAHAVVGDRIFPQTFAIDDPDVLSGLSLPQVSLTRQPNPNGGGSGWVADTTTEFDARLTQDFGISIGGGYTSISNGAGGGNGFDDVDVGGKYVFYRDADSETIMSVGLDWDIGGSGNSAAGADSYSTFTPAFFFGKGLGDLPDDVELLRPFAVTGTLGMAIPDDQGSESDPNPDALSYGFTVQYSLGYLQQHVRDIGLDSFTSHLVPLVEFAFNTPVDRVDAAAHVTTGTVNPGVIWVGEYAQVGVEAMIPINDASGRGVGVIGGAEFYLDDILPKIFGKPLLEQ